MCSGYRTIITKFTNNYFSRLTFETYPIRIPWEALRRFAVEPFYKFKFDRKKRLEVYYNIYKNKNEYADGSKIN